MQSRTEQRQWQFREGDTVFASDGEKVGKLHAIDSNFLIISKGWLFPTEVSVPASAVDSYDDGDGEIYLNVTKDQALNSGWDTYEGSSSGYAGDVLNDEMSTNRGATGDMTKGSTGTRSIDDTFTVPVHEEHLEATTTSREAGAVRINKDVIEEDQTLTVPVTEEKVNITRQIVDRDTVTGEEAFRDETIEVPLRRDEVNVEARDRVVEEVQVSREKVQKNQNVTGTVRKEVVDVENASDDDSHISGV